jgi:hypothetical protein
VRIAFHSIGNALAAKMTVDTAPATTGISPFIAGSAAPSRGLSHGRSRPKR